MVLRGKTALITGGAKRLGRATALSLAEAGVNVAVHYRASSREAEETVAEAAARGVRSWAVSADLNDPEQAEGLLDRVVAMAGPVDVLINNASIFPETGFWELAASDVMRNTRVNAVAPLLIARRFTQQGRPGHIVNFLDCRIVDYDAAHVPYHLSKRMLFTLTRIMALEFAPRIQVNAIAPGLILPPEGKDETYLEHLAQTNPLKRYGNAGEITAALLFLLSSDFITGQVIFVDGGRHIMGNVYG